MVGLPKELFLAEWPNGYIEDFDDYKEGSEYRVAGVIGRFADKNATCLEIGSGGGFWTTKYLINCFKKVICLDLIPQPEALKIPQVEYVELGNCDYSCSTIQPNSIDFVFSFGLFCHLPSKACLEYLKSIHRVMKPGAYGAIMFANWIRHPRIKAKPEDNYIIYANQLGCPGMGWYYCDETITRNLITIAGFVNYEDSLPDFRDTMAVFKKKP